MRTQHCSADSRSHGVPGALNSKLGRLGTANIYFSVPAFVVLFRESLEVRLHSYDLQLRAITWSLIIIQGKESASTPKSLRLYARLCGFLKAWPPRNLLEPPLHSAAMCSSQASEPGLGMCVEFRAGEGVPVGRSECVGIEISAFTTEGSRAISEHILVLQSAGRTRSWT